MFQIFKKIFIGQYNKRDNIIFNFCLIPDLLYHSISMAFLLIFFIAGCNKYNPLQSGFRPDIIIENYKTTNYKNGITEWTLEAEKASVYYNEKRSIAENIFLRYYKESKAIANVKAEQAVLYSESMDIDLIGNVNMISETGNRLLTHKIRWKNKDASLDTDEYIKILKKNGDIIEGIGLKADYNLDTYEIKHKVKAVTTDIPDSVENK